MPRRLVTSIVTVALLFAGCSKAVVIPRELAAEPRYREPGSYRIRLQGWNEYYARRFSVTDSTVVIEELLKSDDRYKLMRHDMPIVIPASEVSSISTMETNRPVTIAVIAGLGLAAAYMTWLFIALSGLSGAS
jgi:hypothetical protein